MRVKILKTYNIFLLSFFVLALSFSLNGIVENFVVRKQIREFISHASFIEPSDSYSYDINTERHYIVKSIYEYEKDINNYDHKTTYVGSTGDIVLTNRNPVPELDFLKPIIKYFWLGHAALVLDDKGENILEIVGNDTLESNAVQESINDFGSVRTGEVVGLRVNKITSEEREKVLVEKDKYLGKKYNFLFLIRLANRVYCLDLISRLYKDVAINLNYDFWITTGSDMIVSSKTHIFYYSYVDKRGILHKYYLE